MQVDEANNFKKTLSMAVSQHLWLLLNILKFNQLIMLKYNKYVVA